MAQRGKINFEELLKNQQKVAEMKKKQEEKRLHNIEVKSAFFKKPFGKIFWWFCVLTAVFSATLIIDNWLGTTYTEFEIKDSKEDKVGLIKGGFVVNSTFNWVYLNDNNSFGFHIHHIDFEKINEHGKMNIGRSKIFKVPKVIKYKNDLGVYQKLPLENSLDFTLFIPLFIFIFSGLWLLAKPHKSYQWIMYGYIMMVVIPIGFTFLLIQALQWINDVGLYEIQVAYLAL